MQPKRKLKHQLKLKKPEIMVKSINNYFLSILCEKEITKF